MKIILGIDIGTSSLKVSAFSEDLTPICDSRQSYPTIYTSGGGCEQNALNWWRELTAALVEVSTHISLRKIEAIGFSGFNALVGVDLAGAACGPAITYLDQRVSQVFPKLSEQIPKEFIFMKTKNNFTTGGTWAPTLCWLKENMPDYWARSETFLSSSGFLAGLLTKKFVVDGSRASLSLLHDVSVDELDWDNDLCKSFGIDRMKLPSIHHSWECIGTVQADAAELTGLPEGIPVIVGGMDSMCAALGSGVFDDSSVFDIGGSAGGLAKVSTQLHADPRFLNVRYVLPNRWAAIGPLSVAGSAWKWLLKDMLHDRFTSEELTDRAKEISPGSKGLLFLPYLAGSRSPI